MHKDKMNHLPDCDFKNSQPEKRKVPDNNTDKDITCLNIFIYNYIFFSHNRI